MENRGQKEGNDPWGLIEQQIWDAMQQVYDESDEVPKAHEVLYAPPLRLVMDYLQTGPLEAGVAIRKMIEKGDISYGIADGDCIDMIDPVEALAVAMTSGDLRLIDLRRYNEIKESN